MLSNSPMLTVQNYQPCYQLCTKFRLTRLFELFQGNLQDSRHSSLLAIWLVLAFNFCKFLLQQTDFSLPHILAEYNEKKNLFWLVKLTSFL